MSFFKKIFGWTPLQLAAQKGDVNQVRILLDQGYDVNQKGYKNTTALPIAIEGKHLTVVTLLLERGADVNVTGHI